MTLKAAELFAGYGGLALAVEEVFGAETAWFSEFEDAPSRILAHHWPTVPNYGDVTKIDFTKVPPVDIISGGSPCQDLSTAGRRKGMTDGTRSNLWVQMREAIATIQPTYVVWENVRGATSAKAHSDLEPCPGCMGNPRHDQRNLRALGRVLGDLSDLGYDCQWRGLRAADVGAPHGRYRIFVLATHARSGRRAETVEHYGRSQAAGNRAGVPHEPDRDPLRPRPIGTRWGQYEPAIRRWEALLGRPAPAPTEPTGRRGQHQLSARLTEWMMGLPDGWITDVPGITRYQALKAAGNGVVPQQAAVALRDMLKIQAMQEAA